MREIVGDEWMGSPDEIEINAGIAQLVEQLFCNQQVVGSKPSTGTNIAL